MKPYVFLLGGHDLEMDVIKQILTQEQIPFFDKQLQWGAKLSSYEQILKQYASKPDTEVYGIELEHDVDTSSMRNYHRIDHHNEMSAQPSSLEQVLQLLGIPMNRYHRLVAANDVGYISGMEKINATKDEIIAIRRAERRSLSISEAEEQEAKQDIEKLRVVNDLLVVETSISHFSAICDLLYESKYQYPNQYKNLLIYTEDEATYYGRLVPVLRKKTFEKELQPVEVEADGVVRKLHKMYYGGNDGYLGIAKGAYERDVFYQYINRIITMHQVSYHIFYYPFEWHIKDRENLCFSDQVKFEGIELRPDKWKRTFEPQSDDEKCLLYSEKNYYYPFVHDILYDNGASYQDGDTDGDVQANADKLKKKTLILHFEREEPKRGDVYYEITLQGDRKKGKKDKLYRLRVDAMNVNLYATGTGLLSFYLSNEDEEQQTEQDILNINQFGRRIMPPFLGENNITEVSKCIGIKGLGSDDSEHKRYRQDFSAYAPENTWTPACFITNLLDDLSGNLICNPVIDDRMFVSCWYKNDERAKEFSMNPFAYKRGPVKTVGTTEPFNSFWYRFLFVDGESLTCQDDEMQERLLDEHSYTRWQKWCSLYGATRYSMMFLTSSTAPDHLLRTFETIYARMVELTLVQRASLLRFSKEVENVSHATNLDLAQYSDRVSSIYKEYIHFINQVYFREVTAQEQGIELYDLLQSNLNLKDYVENLDGEIEELHTYVSLKEARARDEKAAKLNKIATWALPASVIAGLFGMNELSSNLLGDWFVACLIILVVSLIVAYKIRDKKQKL